MTIICLKKSCTFCSILAYIVRIQFLSLEKRLISMHSFSALEINFKSYTTLSVACVWFNNYLLFNITAKKNLSYMYCIFRPIWQRNGFFFLHASVNTSQRVYISAIVETYLLCGVSIPFIFRRFPFATPFMCSRFLFLFGTPLMCSRTPFFLITVVLILFLCSINKTCSSLNTRQSSGWIFIRRTSTELFLYIFVMQT